MLAVYQTGVQYHFYHALGLVAVGLMLLHLSRIQIYERRVGLMLAGIIPFFRQSLCAEPDGVRGLGAITPFGGVAFLSAWGMLAYGAGLENRSSLYVAILYI